MPQKVISPAFALSSEVSSGGEVSRRGFVRLSVRPKRHVSQRNVDVIEGLRERIRCIEGRSSVLDPIKPAAVQAPRQSAAVANGLSDDINHQTQGAHGTKLSREPVSDQTGFPAARFVDEDGGALPRALPSSSFSQDKFTQSEFSTQQDTTDLFQSDWTLGDVSKSAHRDLSGQSLTELSLDAAGVHEIKPALDIDGISGLPSGGTRDWAASWSAARAFALSLIARRSASQDAAGRGSTEQAMHCPILWCMPRGARAEHGALCSHGLKRYGLTSADVLMVETGNLQDTLWVLEEGLKSESLSMVVCMIDDVALTPARRLALAAQKYRTPCLLLTHPRMPPVGATATRWRVAAVPTAPHPLNRIEYDDHGLRAGRLSLRFNGIGARRFGLALERYRAAPANVTGLETIVEWSDEALCLRMVADIPDRSPASRFTALRAAQATFRAG